MVEDSAASACGLGSWGVGAWGARKCREEDGIALLAAILGQNQLWKMGASGDGSVRLATDLEWERGCCCEGG